jgi:rhodanese-related sulfurtransferase
LGIIKKGMNVTVKTTTKLNSSATDSEPSLEFDSAILETLMPISALLSGHRTELSKACQQHIVFSGQVLFKPGCQKYAIFLLAGDAALQVGGRPSEIIKGRSSYLPINYGLQDASATAVTDCTVLKIEHEILDQLLTWSQVAEYLMVDIAGRPEFADDQEWITQILQSNLFYKVPPINITEIFSLLKSRVVEAEEVIVRQGELGDSCFFIKEGEARVTRMNETSHQSEFLADIGVGRCFGEDALINTATRNATVVMTSNGVLMELNKADFVRLYKEPDLPSLESLGTNEEKLVLDVRACDEYEQGHLGSAINIPLNLLCLKQRQLSASQSLLVYCNSGRRSRAAAALLKRQGFDAYYLKGGLDGQSSDTLSAIWTTKDFVLVDGKPRIGT